MFKDEVRRSLSLVFLMAAFLPALAAPAANPVLEQAAQDLRQGAVTLDVSSLERTRATLGRLMKAQPRDPAVALQLARADDYLATAYQLRGNRRQVAQALKAAASEAQRAVALQPKNAVAHALYSDLLGRRLSQGGMLAAIRNGPRLGPKLNAELEAALQLNPHNPFVLECEGRKFLFAPRLFGGDVNKAVERFRQAAALAPDNPEALTWLGTALAAQGNRQQARQQFEQALKISPHYALARHELDGLK